MQSEKVTEISSVSRSVKQNFSYLPKSGGKPFVSLPEEKPEKNVNDKTSTDT